MMTLVCLGSERFGFSTPSAISFCLRQEGGHDFDWFLFWFIVRVTELNDTVILFFGQVAQSMFSSEIWSPTLNLVL
jgi:hypothetical protein